jgi:predicted amidohydrolase YtcJ
MAILLRGRTLLTQDPARPRAEAVGIDGNRIVAVGDVEDVRRTLPPDAREIDAGDRTVVPGFIDAHNHYLATAESFAGVEARDVTSIAELQRRVGEFAERQAPGTWIRGHGVEWSAFAEGRLPNRHDLDEVSQAHPILLEHVSGHAILVNSLAMSMRGVRDDVRDPEAGTFDRDERGRPTGIARDAATNLLLGPSVDIGHHGPNFHTELDVDDGVRMLEAAAPRYFGAGLTTVADPQVSRRELGIYREAHRRGIPGPRIVAMPLSHQLDELIDIGLAGPFGDERLRIGAMKFYTDGAITAGTAAFSEGLGPRRSTGTFYHEPDEFRSLIATAHAAGWRIAIHTMGDLAFDLALGALEDAFRAHGSNDPRPRVEHGTYPTAPQRERMAALGMIPVTQPASIRELGNVWKVQLGSRLQDAMPMRAWLDLGIRPVISSDAFVQSYRPLDTISAATWRMTPDGMRAGAHHELTIDEAVRSHTIDAARAIGLEDRLGSIEVGKLADIAVLDGDLLGAEPSRIGELETWLTIQDGAIVHHAGGESAPTTIAAT